MSEVTRLTDQGMITLRADLSALSFPVPATRTVRDGVAWMSPDELLIMVPKAEVPAKMAALASGLPEHHLLADVSDARAVFALTGDDAREVLAKGAPVDLSPDSFQIGDIRRTRIGQVAAAFWMVDAQTFHIVCFTSVSGYLEDWLRHASRESAMVTYF